MSKTKTHRRRRLLQKMSDTETGRRRKFLICVDDTSECRLALRWACRRARATGGDVALLRVIEPGDFQHWIAVEERHSEEAREEAENLLKELASEISVWTDIVPELMVREGRWHDEVLALIDEDQEIRDLVLGTKAGSEEPGPLVSSLVGHTGDKLHIPVTVVPGSLTVEQIDELA